MKVSKSASEGAKKAAVATQKARFDIENSVDDIIFDAFESKFSLTNID